MVAGVFATTNFGICETSNFITAILKSSCSATKWTLECRKRLKDE